jgi:predicted nucleic acid-binding protein
LITYPDNSFLCALYRNQDNSVQALEFSGELTEPLRVTRLLLWEFRQSARFQAFRNRKDPSSGYPMTEAEKMIAKVGEHLEGGKLKLAHCDFLSVLATAEGISRSRTFSGGHRSFDVLHVATALALDAREFLSFDSKQNALAAAEGLATPLRVI